MPKKRRNVSGPVAQRAPNATTTDHKPTKNTLDTIESYYDQSSGEAVRVSTTLERTLLLHNFVLLAVQNALMVVQTVTNIQIASAIGTALWMMRKNLVRLFLPRVALIVGSNREFVLRKTVLGLASVGLGVVYYVGTASLSAFHLLAFAVAFLLDAVVVYLLKGAQGHQTPRRIFLSAVEVTYLVTGLPICVNFNEKFIYDIMAFALTATTAFVHVGVLLAAKHVVIHCFVWQDVDRFEPEQVLAGNSKKKRLKSKIRASPSKTRSTKSNSRASQIKQSLLEEPHVQFAILIFVQLVLLFLQLMLSAFVLYSWEMTSALMLSSSHVLWTLGRVRRNVLSRHVVPSKLKSE